MDKHVAAEVAAKWWTSEVRLYSDHFKGRLFSKPRTPGHILAPTEQELALFEQTLRDAIIERIKDDAWIEDNPQWASSIRVFGSDYGPDLTLDKAFKAAGFSALLCPSKTIMWVNPDKVYTNTGFEWTPESTEVSKP